MRHGQKILWVIFILLSSNTLAAQSRLTLSIRAVSPYILKIYTYDLNNSKTGQASGIILSTDGTCVTNYHVLSGAISAEAVTSNGIIYKIESIIDYNQQQDLAKFKIKPNSAFPIKSNLQLNLASPEIGTDVFSIGYPSSFESNTTYTVSTGIISGYRTENNDKFIQTSTPITHGSSGGGLFNYSGQLVGVTQGTFVDDVRDRHANLNKAVPTNFLTSLKTIQNLSLKQFNLKNFNSDIIIQALELYDSEKFAEAIPLFISYLKTFPENPFIWFKYGTCLLYMKEFQDPQLHYQYASDALENSVILDSTNYYAWSNLCLAQLYLTNYENAYHAISKAYQLAPMSSKVLGIFGQYHSYQKDYRSAIPFFTNAINNAPRDNSKKFMAAMYLERAISNAWLGQDDKSYDDYIRSINLDPLHEESYWWFINFLTTRKKWSEACSYSRKLKSLNPTYKNGETTIDKMLNYTCNK